MPRGTPAAVTRTGTTTETASFGTYGAGETSRNCWTVTTPSCRRRQTASMYRSSASTRRNISSVRTLHYRSPTKLREGNVFSPVCLSFCLFAGGPCTRSQTPSVRALAHPIPYVQGLPTCSDLFNLDFTVQGPLPLGHVKTCSPCNP